MKELRSHAGAPALAALLLSLVVAACGGQPGTETVEAPAPEGVEHIQLDPVTADAGRGYAPPNTPAELGVAGYTKVLCSAVFVSGRDPREAARNSGFFLMAKEHRDQITDVLVDRQQKLVRMSLANGITRTAKLYGDQGCIIHPMDKDGIYFEPVPVTTTLPDASTEPWPMGDALPDDPLPPEIDPEKLKAAEDAAFAGEGLTAAFLVTHKGRIIAERYMDGIDKDTQLESWSMGKSLTATLLALLVKDGDLVVEDPAPVPEWQAPDDPRRAIRILDLLRMSSGLRFIAGQDPDYTPELGYPDHMLIYTGALDAFHHSVTRPPQFPPNTEGRYRNSDPLTLGYIIKRTVTERGEEYLTFPQRALFDRIGIRRQVLETDPYGNFLLTGYDYGTARNWARIGMLHLQDGIWGGERILPEGWVQLVSTPAPAWTRPVYGGQWWLNGEEQRPIPKSAFWAAGGGGQTVIVIPTHDMVVVRLGHFRGAREGGNALNEALKLLMEAVPESKAS
ncbi:MAG: serine hydrolase domain-containing protein [Vicinamibacteria bacterium]